MKHVLLVGNPNSGKTTLFNALTGDNQRIGNWPGVTVEKKTGFFQCNKQTLQITDLPGVYSLAVNHDAVSQDEQIAAQAILDLKADCIINVVDACHLERHLYLTSQLIELGRPLILVLNMMDIAEQRGIHIDTKALSRALNLPVLGIQAHKQIGLNALYEALQNSPPKPAGFSLKPFLPQRLENKLVHLKKQFSAKGIDADLAHYYACRWLEGDSRSAIKDRLIFNILDVGQDDDDILMADARYASIHQIVQEVQRKKSDMSDFVTARIDRIVLHRFWGIPIFLGMMYLMFLFAINIGGAFQDFFDISTDAIFVQGTAWLLYSLSMPNWLIAILANGVGKGINTTLTFIPVIASMFFFLSLLEASGYMARAAFVVDKLMRLLGLPGKSFVPMIVGFGCNVPAIMAARTLDSERDRRLTIMMSPFMSCSARLAIYTVFVAAFFPVGGQNIVFSLYLIGILMAVLTGFMLRKTHFQGQSSPLILELPAYHKPSLRRLFKETKVRLNFFVLRAGKLIIPICILLGALNAIMLDGSINSGEASSQSLLSLMGKWLTPMFAPMGLSQDNWPATVGLLTGMLAKEVVVGSLNSLYAQVGHFSQMAVTHFNLWGSLKEAFYSVPENFSSLGEALLNPILASAPDSELSQSVYGMMAQRFDGQAGAFAYLLFILLYIPCVSTMAVIRQEASKRLMWLSVIWSFVLAYSLSVVFYQLARFSAHPQQSLLWVLAMFMLIAFFIALIRFNRRFNGNNHVISTS
ncbi:Fe(2+) transporter permease subunit FeoB [Legionella israelensis]|uniref:Ferrous iron transport protein B n=1 Tax=Legionella israelensis TaxID=454 RepID=A0A0W0W1K3_9GAMM|nr:Fe(2+) transporter permease subunit FeoB [Legionella israelensis]KTD26098.1 ferrous iron transport protein B [Legionella israelensis]QBS10115.1 Fe(2+) transporter permease subunit FeoB [Legionella israelensis]SCY07903.1 ferrous iron transport protein B [Legionella israelensis DSM 19235]STX59702.1 ferrous iron transport protein B [Legionella israelensis]